MKSLQFLFVFLLILGCQSSNKDVGANFLTDQVPDDTPLVFMADLAPKDAIIHKGIFSPDLKAFYYTLSDKAFERFDVYVIKKQGHRWSKPEKAFFNSEFNEHGMSFSPDGKTLYFSSTRPVNMEGVPATWHIWKSEKKGSEWTKPTFVDIPNLRDKSVSHPTVTNTGTLYFHSSELDYSKMSIYHSALVNGKYSEAVKTQITLDIDVDKCTPYVSPDEDYLMFATVGNELELVICSNNGNGVWQNARKLNKQINTLGQGNPYVTPGDQFLFFTSGDHTGSDWKLKWVNIENELKVSEKDFLRSKK